MQTIDIFERMASQYDIEERVSVAKIISQNIKSVLPDVKDKTAMDYGCGTGLVGLDLAERFKHIVFADMSENMIAVVKDKLKNAGMKNASAVCCDLLSSPLEMKVDYIIMSQVLLHVKDYVRLLDSLYGMLNVGGSLIIVDFDKNENVVSDMVHNGFEKSQLIAECKQRGFSDVQAGTFYHGERMFMKQDASLFLLIGKKA